MPVAALNSRGLNGATTTTTTTHTSRKKHIHAGACMLYGACCPLHKSRLRTACN